MKHRLKRKIAFSVLSLILGIILFTFSVHSQITGMITSDGSYTSPQSDGDYSSPESDESYESPTTGSGYVAPTSDNSYETPTSDQSYETPTSDESYESPTTGDGYVEPGTYNITCEENCTLTSPPLSNTTPQENQTQDIKNTTETKQSSQPNQNISNTSHTNTSKQTEQKSNNDEISKWPFVGKWRVLSYLISYESGDWEFAESPTTLLDIKDTYEWEFGSMKGTWSVQPIAQTDWEKWQITSYGPKVKLVFEGWDGKTVDGPMEGDVIWIIYNEDAKDERGKQNIQMKFRIALSEWKYTFRVEKVGAGLVRSLDKVIDCGTTCVKKIPSNTMVTLIATPDDGWTFSGWSGACTTQESVCRVTVDSEKKVTAHFQGACTEDSQCPLDQTCSNSTCVQVACACGVVIDHTCQAYACCSDEACDEGSVCNLEVHQCIEKSQCREVIINGDPAEKHDLVFVGAGFHDYDTLEKAIRLLMDFDGSSENKLGVFSLTPFKENNQKFNTWMVIAPQYLHHEEQSPLEGFGNLIVPNEDEYEPFVRSCNRDTVIVLSPGMFRPWAHFPTSGASGGVVFMSLNNPLYGSEFFGRTLAHEMGHAIGGLADEYVEYGGDDRTEQYEFPNCAPNLESAEQKWGDLVGVRGVHYYTGTPNIEGTQYYKSTEPMFPQLGFFPDGSDWGDGGCAYVHKNIRPMISTIMGSHYTLDNDFGPVNERVLSQKLEGYS